MLFTVYSIELMNWSVYQHLKSSATVAHIWFDKHEEWIRSWVIAQEMGLNQLSI